MALVDQVNAPVTAAEGRLSEEFARLVSALFKAEAQNTRLAWDALAEFVVENNQDIQKALLSLDV